MADRYTRDELEQFLESGEPPPSPLTRKLISREIRRLAVAEKEAEKEAAVSAAVAEKEAEKEAAVSAAVAEKEAEKKAARALGKLEGKRYAVHAWLVWAVNAICTMIECRASASSRKRCALCTNSCW